MSGVLPRLVDAIARFHDPPLAMTLLDGWRSDQSMAHQRELQGASASSYTACVQDVAVGKVDICISERPHCERLHSHILPAHCIVAISRDGMRQSSYDAAL